MPLLVIAAALVVGCASTPRVRPSAAADSWPALVARADASAAEGCYRCLVDAVAAYEDALALRADAGVGMRAYRAAVLLALRERLIGLWPAPGQDALLRVAAHGSREDQEAAETLLATVPWRRGTRSVEMMLRAVAPGALQQLRAAHAWLLPQDDTDAWSATLHLTLLTYQPFAAIPARETRGGHIPGRDPDVWWARHPDDRTLTFTRLALLPGTTIDDWQLLLQRAPVFDEAWALIGEAELARGRLVSADDAFARALDALPDLLPARVLRGDVQQRLEAYEHALLHYDEALARQDDHREALLGRLKVLGFLHRHEQALGVADRMLALGEWYLGEAYYWKAWNLFQLTRLPEAWAAVDQARTLLVSADVSYLGGVIAYRQDRLDDALADFNAAVALEAGHCDARFNSAAIHLQRRGWEEASRTFDEAFVCHQARTPALEARIEEARGASRLTQEQRDALVDRRTRDLTKNRAQEAWARYNGGVAHANAGRAAVARTHGEEAARFGGPVADAAKRLLQQLPQPTPW